MNDDKLDQLYQKYWLIHNQMVEEGYLPFEIAGILIAQGLTFYKTLMNDDEYYRMVETIYNRKDSVKKINTGFLQ